MRKRYTLDTLSSDDMHEIVKIGGKLIENHEGVNHRGNFKITPFRKFIEKMFAVWQKYEDEHKDSMQNSVDLFMNSLCGVQIRKDNNESYKRKSQNWVETKYDDNVLDYWRLPNRKYIIKLKKMMF